MAKRAVYAGVMSDHRLLYTKRRGFGTLGFQPVYRYRSEVPSRASLSCVLLQLAWRLAGNVVIIIGVAGIRWICCMCVVVS